MLVPTLCWCILCFACLGGAGLHGWVVGRFALVDTTDGVMCIGAEMPLHV